MLLGVRCKPGPTTMAAIGKRVRVLSEWSQVRILPIDNELEGVLLTEVELKPEKSVSSPSKYRFTAATASTTSGVGAPRSAPGNRRNRARSAAAALFVGN